MQKLKKEIYTGMLSAELTNSECELLLYITHYQTERGRTVGIYYKDVCEVLDIAYQSFYNALYGLEKKNIIAINKGSYYDWDVLIKCNDFTYPEAMQEGYLNTGHAIFYDERFKKLKVKEKLLAMYFIMAVGANDGKSYRIGCEKFYEKFQTIFGITKRVLQGYLRTLKEFFSIGIKKGIYWITPLKAVFKGKAKTDKEMFADGFGRAVIRRNRAKYDDRTKRDTINLISQYIGDCGEAVQDFFTKAVEKSLYQKNRWQENPYKWNRKLQPAFIHMLLREEINAKSAE